jgi:hypothetical protein
MVCISRQGCEALGNQTIQAEKKASVKNHRAKFSRNSKIPPPPGLEAGYDAIIQYHGKYSMDELEKAGYLEEVPDEEAEEMAASATFQILCREGLNLKLNRREYEKLSRLAAKERVDVKTIVKRWIKKGLEESRKLAAHARR